jgi:PKD repeat protein
MDFTGANASICDSNGELILYSNGMHIHDSTHTDIINGDTIGYSDYWDIWVAEDYYPNGDDWITGYPGIQMVQILPVGDKYYIIYKMRKIEGQEATVISLNYSIINKTEDGKYEVEAKDIVVHEDEFNFMQINATRHANGQDWWMTQQNKEADSMYVYLINEDGISLHNTLLKEKRTSSVNTLPQTYFSPAGDKLAISHGQSIPDNNTERIFVNRLFDFDRCTGDITELGSDTTVNKRLFGICSFSPSGQYLYTSSYDTIYQYDVWAEDWVSTRTSIAGYDGFFFQYDFYGSPMQNTELGPMITGPDGRIYSVPPGDNRYLNVIEYPDEKGIDAEVVQHKINLPTQNFRSVPNFPNFRLGPQDGSPCDTLGYDNHPEALFRYAQDTSDYLNVRFTDLSYYEPTQWLWEFVDGTTYDGKKPYYHKFDEDGAYEVCLTVSNDNSSNKYCKTLYLGVTSTDNTVEPTYEILLYPNPVIDQLSIDIRNYLPADANVNIYNELGQLVLRLSVYGGWNSIDVVHLNSGFYFYTIIEKGRSIHNGKFVKQ